MRKFLVAAVTLALCALVPAIASAQVNAYKTQQLKILTSKAASVTQAANDSFTVSLGAANTNDTTYAFGPISWVGAAPDSQQLVVAAFTFASAIASGESVYVVPQGSGNGVDGWSALNAGTIPIGASLTGQVASGAVPIAATQNSATNVAGKQPVGAKFYGSWGGWPYLRFIVISDKSAAMVANTYRLSVSFPSVINRGPN